MAPATSATHATAHRATDGVAGRDIDTLAAAADGAACSEVVEICAATDLTACP